MHICMCKCKYCIEHISNGKQNLAGISNIIYKYIHCTCKYWKFSMTLYLLYGFCNCQRDVRMSINYSIVHRVIFC